MKNLSLLLLFIFFVSCSKDETEDLRFSVNTAVVPANAGSVSVEGDKFRFGDIATLTAIPAEGYEFKSWTGNITGNENPVAVEVKDNMEVTAMFGPASEAVVIYTINDPHGKINNFAKIKAILDEERETNSRVFFVSGGDIFSGNPIVDYHPQKGFPIIDLMNKTGMDVSALGNHEFDYGQEILNKRMQQAEFPFLCANVNKQDALLEVPQGHAVIEKDGLKIAFLSVVETGSNGKPSTHPKKVEGLQFSEGVNALNTFEDTEAVVEADLVVALTHYGSYGDRRILEQHDFVDLAIGGHNHAIYNEEVNGRYMVQSGSDLKYLTKLSLKVQEGVVVQYQHEIIDLSKVTAEDAEMKNLIAQYNNQPEFFNEIGTSLQDHNSAETGCFYTDALRSITGADIVFQNYGGIRAGLDYGKITPFDIYTIDPFGNGLESYTMTVGEIETFLNSQNVASLAYSGVQMYRKNGVADLYDASGKPLPNDSVLKVSLSDYISNVYVDYFGTPDEVFEKTTAEYLIEYLQGHQSVIDYENCNRGI